MSKREDLHAQLSLIQLPVDTGVCNVLQLCCNPSPPFLFNWPPIILPLFSLSPHPHRGFTGIRHMAQQPQFGGSLWISSSVCEKKQHIGTLKPGWTNVGNSFHKTSSVASSECDASGQSPQTCFLHEAQQLNPSLGETKVCWHLHHFCIVFCFSLCAC